MGSNSPSTNTVTSVSQLPPHISAASEGNINLANTIAARPWQPPPMQRIASWTPQMNQAVDKTTDTAFDFQPQMQTASDTTGGIATDSGPGDVSKFFNPHMDAVYQELARQGQIQRQGIDKTAIARGAWNGGRHGVVEGAQREGETRNAGLIASKAYADAVNQSMQNKGIQLSGANQLAQLAGTNQNMKYRDINALMDVGSAKRGQEQELMTQMLNDWLEQRDWDVRGLNIRSSALGVAPYERTTVQTSPGGNTTAQAVGAAGGLGALGYQIGGAPGAAAGGGLGLLAGLLG